CSVFAFGILCGLAALREASLDHLLVYQHILKVFLKFPFCLASSSALARKPGTSSIRCSSNTVAIAARMSSSSSQPHSCSTSQISSLLSCRYALRTIVACQRQLLFGS